MPSLITSRSRKLYLDCNRLPLDKYQDCLFDNELSALIVEGTATQEELQELWDKIYLESMKLSQGDSYNELFELTKKINDLNGKLMIVQCSVEHLQLQWSQSIVNILNELGMRCDIKPQHTGATLINKLNAIIGRAKKWAVTVDQRRADIARIRDDNKKGDELTRGWFDNELDALSQFYKCPLIQPNQITVARFWNGRTKLDQYIQKENAKKYK